MLVRINDFGNFFGVGGLRRKRILLSARSAAFRSQGMIHLRDYLALGSVIDNVHPTRIFEIGTYLGTTSEFFMRLVPNCMVVSIAYINSNVGRRYNNSQLPTWRIGCAVRATPRSRFTQLLGDSHDLSSDCLIRQFGRFDLVFIDGDHSTYGVAQDTTLALSILSRRGVVCWHDSSPKPKYVSVRQYLERIPTFLAISTPNTYIGGLAVWSRAIEARLDRWQ
jgi:predicted O-methyltransferase YrrM